MKPISIAALVLVVPQIAAVLATGWLLCRMSPKAFMVKDNIGMGGGQGRGAVACCRHSSHTLSIACERRS